MMNPIMTSLRFRPSLLASSLALLAAVLLPCTSASAVEAQFSIQPLSEQQATRYQLDPSFFKKGTLVQNILIATSANVSDFTHREAAYQFDMVMKSIRPDIAQRIREREVLCVLVGHQELTSDVPMFASDKKGKELDFYNWRQRGFLTTKHGRPVVLFAEEDVLEYEGGMQLESILIHEFGHVIQGAGFDKELNERVKAAFENAKQKGIYHDGYAAQKFRRVKSATPVSLLDSLAKSFPDQTPEFLRRCLDGGDILVNGRPVRADAKVTKEDKVLIVFGGPKPCYALVNAAEYWAEGVQDWYDTNRTMDHDHNHIHTREQLKRYDPELAKLCAEVLGDSDWRFVSPRKRAGQGHLAGYNPATAPSVVKLEHIDQAAQDYYDKYWKEFWKRLHDKHQANAGNKSPR